MRIVILLLGALLLMSEINGCATHTADMLPFEKRTPGNPISNNYGTNFDVDYDIVKNGATYNYSLEGNIIHGLGGGRTAYGRFGILTMDFEFEDGRIFHEVLDLRELMANMLQKYEIFDLSKTQYGGYAQLFVKIDSKRLLVDYVLYAIKSDLPLLMTYYHYPVFEKDFSESDHISADAVADHQVAGTLPGKPELNLCGISFESANSSLSTGSYTYSPNGNAPIDIANGGRFGYQTVGELSLDLSFQDGRKLHTDIDLQPLLQNFQNSTEIIDLSATKFSGYAEIVVSITQDKLKVDYRLLERNRKNKLSEMKMSETFKKSKNWPEANYRLIKDLMADPSQFREHRYPLFSQLLSK